jgi:hypothetical protein
VPPSVLVPKSASLAMKHLVSALLQSAGRSMIHSAEARWQLAHAATLVGVTSSVTLMTAPRPG